MLKVIPRNLSVGALFLLVGVAGCAGGCAGSKPKQYSLRFEQATRTLEAKELWSNQVKGFITDLAVSKSGNAVLVGTIPDYEQDKFPKQFLVELLDSEDGDAIWRSPQKAQVRALDVSEDGELAVVANYAGEVVGIGRDGKVRWTASGVCRPMILSRVKKVICYHDDDADPEIAFDVFDWNGKKIHSHPISNDILALKVSDDQRWLAIGLTRGQIQLLGQDFKRVWSKTIDGEVLDVGISSGDRPLVSALAVKKGQRLSVLDHQGKLLAQSQVAGHAEQVEMTPDGKGVLVYGNGPRGQFVGAYSSSDLKVLWQRTDARYADYSAPMLVADQLVLIGFENVQEHGRQSFILGFDNEGKLKTSIPLETDEGAYIYSQAFSSSRSFLAVGTDDGKLAGFKLEPKEP